MKIEKIQEKLENIANEFLFVDNNEQTRNNIKSSMERFLSQENVENFVIVCDERNNTSERIKRNELWVDVKLVLENNEIYIPIRIMLGQKDIAA